MSERRLYSRVSCDTDGVIFIGDNEYVCKVKNLSRMGVCLEVSDCDIINEDLNKVIEFATYYRFRFFRLRKFKVISSKCKVIRVFRDKDKIILGCKLIKRDEDIQKYIDDIRVEKFLEQIKYNF